MWCTQLSTKSEKWKLALQARGLIEMRSKSAWAWLA